MNLEDLNMTEEELDELQDLLNNRKKIKIYEKNIEKIDRNKEYIGKCYKEKNSEKYIYVLSSKSSNEYRTECMCFEFPITFHEQHHLTKIFNPDNAFSTIDFDGIYVEDYPLFCSNVLKGLKEITKEEYFSKMDEWYKLLKDKILNDDFNTSKNNKSMFS